MLCAALSFFAVITAASVPRRHVSDNQVLVEKTVMVSGYVCAGVQTAWVVRPANDKQYPLVSFAHGYGSGGDSGVKGWYTHIIRNISSSGYVVVALESGSSLCLDEFKDQIHSIAWAMNNSELLPHINKTMGSALVGQSMGGGSTAKAASQADAIALYNIKVACAIHPMSLPGVAPKVPILFLTGTNDTTVSPESVWKQYTKTTETAKAFAEVEGADHVDSTDKGDRRENPYVYDWLDCKIKGDSGACNRVVTCAEPNAAVGGHGCHHSNGKGWTSDLASSV
jgi:dienelactone hydrolase